MYYQCTICQENLSNDTVAAVKCGHTFHLHCISEWFDHSKTCPTCRFKIKSWHGDVVKNVFFDKYDESVNNLSSNGDGEDDKLKKLKHKCNGLESQLTETSKGLAENLAELDKVKRAKDKLTAENDALGRKLAQTEDTAKILRSKCNEYDSVKSQNEKLKNECNRMTFRLRSLKGISSILDGNVEEAENSLCHFDSLEDGKKLIMVLKKRCDEFYKRSNQNEENLRKMEKTLNASKQENVKLETLVRDLKQEIVLMRKRPNQTPYNPKLANILTETPDTSTIVPLASSKKSNVNASTPSSFNNNVVIKKRHRHVLANEFISDESDNDFVPYQRIKTGKKPADSLVAKVGQGTSDDLFVSVAPKKSKPTTTAAEPGQKVSYNGFGGSVRSWSSTGLAPKSNARMGLPKKLSFQGGISSATKPVNSTKKISDFITKKKTSVHHSRASSVNDSVIVLSP